MSFNVLVYDLSMLTLRTNSTNYIYIISKDIMKVLISTIFKKNEMKCIEFNLFRGQKFYYEKYISKSLNQNGFMLKNPQNFIQITYISYFLLF